MEKPKVIFLDVDGVLNTHTSFRAEVFDPLDSDKLDLLAKVVKETGAVVVLSSTWRLWVDSRGKVIRELGLRGVSVIGCTPQLHGMPRGTEIQKWLQNREVERFAILDDMYDAGIGFTEEFFQTDPSDGLTDSIAASIIDFLQQ